MARTRSEKKATEAVQEARDELDLSQDTQGQETPCAVPETVQDPREELDLSQGQEAPCAVPETVQDPYQELMEPDPVPEPAGQARETPGGVEDGEPAGFIEYAVAGCRLLRLRQAPSLATEVVATLPCGMGVMACTRPVVPGWRQVFSGRLCGWVMDEFLEPLEAAEADDG